MEKSNKRYRKNLSNKRVLLSQRSYLNSHLLYNGNKVAKKFFNLENEEKYENKKKRNFVIIKKANTINKILIITYIIINFLFVSIATYNNISNYQKITLKINGKGYNSIYYSNFEYKPNKIYINNNEEYNISNQYFFDKSKNIIELFWDNNIDSTYRMFKKCSNISEIDLSNFNSSQVTNMAYMFEECSSLAYLNFSKLNTSKVTNMIYMFSNCISLESLDLSSFNTSKVEDMIYMFNGCSSLKSLNLSNFNTSKVKQMHNMFNGCSSLIELNISNFDTSQVIYMGYMFYRCSKLNLLNLSNFNVTKVQSMRYMFYGCSNLSSLFLSNFSPSNVNWTYYMFYGCKSLIELNLSRFDTSHTKEMDHMFNGCSKLTSLNLENFNTSQVISMEYMFKDCSNLSLINLSSFDTSNTIKLGAMFYNCSSLKNLNLSNFDTSNTKYMGYMFYNCLSLTSLNLSNFNPKWLLSLRNTFEGCSSLKSLDLSNFDISHLQNISFTFKGCSSLEYINLKNFNNYNKENLISYSDTFKETPDNIVICYKLSDNINDIILNQVKIKKCYTIDCSEDWKKSQKIYDNKTNECINNSIINNNIDNNPTIDIYNCHLYQCLSCPPKKLNIDLCIECNNGYYPKENDPLNVENYINCYKDLEGYYLDKNDFIYKKCYNTCELCETKGDNKNHNCVKCKYNYTIELNINNYKNCYKNCNYYYYFDENNYHCTNEYSCPDEYNKLIIDKYECVNNCKNNDYKYEYNNICYKTNPYPESNIFCDENKPFMNIKINECVQNCNLKDLQDRICILKYKKNETNEKIENEESMRIFIANIENIFISDNYNTSNIENGKDDIIEDDKMKITLTTKKKKKNNIDNNNMTIIDLGECEKLLRHYYNISENENIYMKKIDVKQEGMKIPKILFDIYSKLNGSNLIKLNKSICENTKVTLSLPLVISDNLDKLNSSSGYYNDLCYTATSDSGTDISLNDRKKEYIQDSNRTVCQDDCDFTDYNYKTTKLNCSCKIKESDDNLNVNKTKLYENVNINDKSKSTFNLGITSCNVLSSTDNIKSNTGFYLLLFIFAIFIFIAIIFCTKGYNILENKIDEVIDKKFKKNKKTKKNHKIKKNKKLIKTKKIKTKSPQIVSSSKPKIEVKQSKKIQKNNLITNIIANKTLAKKSKQLKVDTDYELNWLIYKDAIKYDKRDNCSYYCSLIRSKQLFIFTFCSFNDYNSGIIKKFIFFLSFALHYTVNALFFDESTMHQIYEDEGDFNFEYQLPQILYSAIISTIILRLMLHFLVLTDKDISEVKLQPTKNLASNMKKKKLKCIIIKFIIFFGINFILLGLFWYYLTCFNAIYKNTQIYLIETTFISFGFSLIYPFIFNIIPMMIRMSSIHSKNKNQEYCYRISQIIQMI